MKMYQFTGPIRYEWSTFAQCALFAQNISHSEYCASAKVLARTYPEGDIDDSKRDRYMLFCKMIKSEPSMKRFVSFVISLVSSG